MSKDYLQLMKDVKINTKDGDTEDYHIAADKLLCELLIELGYKEVVDEFNKLGKWYA